jgi:hypothetical protein
MVRAALLLSRYAADAWLGTAPRQDTTAENVRRVLFSGLATVAAERR